MRARPRNPAVYEINTWVWLGELRLRLILDLVPNHVAPRKVAR